MEQKLAWLRPSRVSGSLMGSDSWHSMLVNWQSVVVAVSGDEFDGAISNAREKGGVVTQV